MPVSWSESQADAASFLAVVPPEPVVDQITRLRREVGLGTSVLPHITLKAQPNLDAPELWRPEVARVLVNALPIRVTLGPIGWFGDDIVFLAVDGEVIDLHHTLLAAVEAVAPGERFEYEGEWYAPHLTLGAAFAGDSVEQLQAIANAADRLCWPAFVVDEVVEFRREQLGRPYVPWASYRFGGPATFTQHKQKGWPAGSA